MEIKALIIEDEEKGIEVLKMLLQKYCPDVMLCGIGRNVEEGTALIESYHPDVVFLDIELNGRTGFDLLEKVGNIDFQIIFTTAYHEYAIKAIKFSALDYLLKPIRVSDLQEAVAKVKSRIKAEFSIQYDVLRENTSQVNPLHKIVLFAQDGLYPVLISDIIYCRADDSYTHIYMKGGKEYTVSKQLKEYEILLNKHNFFRIHKSYLINLNHLVKVNKLDGTSVEMSNGQELMVSIRKKEEFIERLRAI